MFDKSKKQEFNEAILKLMLLIYRIDHKITLQEQDMFDEIKTKLDWESTIHIESFIIQASGYVSQFVNQKRTLELLKELREALSYNAELTLSLASDMVNVDQNVAESEEDILEYLKTKLSAAESQ